MALMKGTVLPYFMDEDSAWGLKVSDIEEQIKLASKQGINTRAIVVINPGNPTGQVLSEDNIRSIIELCAREGILILADEVYQENIWDPEVKFHSFRKVLESMPSEIADSVELLSVHSISKGISGECGLRGGYFETHNFLPEIEEVISKMKAIELCSNTIGQIACTLMVDPPRRGKESEETMNLFEQEYNNIFDGMKERAFILSNKLNEMDNITCNSVQGSMYAFPRIHLNQSAIKKAKDEKVAPDFLYCLEMLNETGIQTVPGSGFGQKKDTYHLRMTNLVSPTEKMAKTLDRMAEFNNKFHKKYN